ncbi:ATP-grasp domain-containing protein [Acrocarpospora corrugata]|uniref:ATP-grasp domain-containing protein n=1 Tax=Acrocarpospora corrugata TaxID=35763 RepID=A0A5M3WCJ1_9ACTN|nr:hypothetical protein [Acrocarpospora corrugata]GES06069.1 ATP-grasp domain-containing protein [Acrocarpospora corrugata]
MTPGPVVLATATAMAEYDVDLLPMADAVKARGAECVAVSWDDQEFDWSAASLVVIRSTWDYSTRLAEYLAWTTRVAALTRLANPAEVIAWNTDKHYLGDLIAAGVPTVPARYVAAGEPIEFPYSGDFVVKPTVSAGARDTARYGPDQHAAAEEHVHLLHGSGRVAMTQPYVTRITEGERALVFLGGRFSHALRKNALLTERGVIDNDRVPHPGLVAYTPTAAELGTASAALAAAPGDGDLLYARVDLAVGDDGEPIIMELELTEPNLFCVRAESGLANFADAVLTATGAG